jgi:serine/threonine protein kinase
LLLYSSPPNLKSLIFLSPAPAANRIVDDEDDFPTPPSRPSSAPAKPEAPAAAVAASDVVKPPAASGSAPSMMSSSGASQAIQSWEIDYNSIEMGAKLGSGAFGEVRLGTWMGTDVAVKILHANDEKSRDVFYKEANLLCQLRHPNVVPFLGASLQGQLAIVMELMPSSLSRLIKSGPIEIKLLCRVASGIARGIMFLHKSNPPIIHRDLKPDNILLDHANVPKLADFGVSREKIATQEMTRIGTPSYCAPEILKGEKYSEKVDIFSFGMILYAMVSGRAPFRGGEGDQALSPLQIMMKIAVQKERPKIPPEVHCPTWLSDLINECWAAKPDQRPTADDVCCPTPNFFHLTSPALLLLLFSAAFTCSDCSWPVQILKRLMANAPK